MPTIPTSALQPNTLEVEDIVAHEQQRRQWYFKANWLAYDDAEVTFEPLSSFFDARGNIITEPLREYIRKHKLPIEL